MKKRIFFLFFIPILLILTVISCTTTPKTTTVENQTQPQTQAQPAPQNQAFLSAITDVESARKRVVDFEGSSYFPSEWETAESNFTSARNMPSSTDADLQKALASLNQCRDSYDELFKKTVPLYAQAREDEILSEREDFISTGLRYTFSEYLEKADEVALTALSQYEAEDYYTAKDTAAKALSEYQLLNLGVKTYLTRQRIIDFGLDGHDPDSYSKTEEIALAALNDFNAGNIDKAKEETEDALSGYNLIIENGREWYAEQKRDVSTAERQRAQSLRANIAVRELFRDAEAIFTLGENALSAGRFEEAAALFTEAEARFMVASIQTTEKQRLANEALKEAETRIDESDETVRNAAIIIEGGSR